MTRALDWIGFQLLMLLPLSWCDPDTRFGVWVLQRAGSYAHPSAVTSTQCAPEAWLEAKKEVDEGWPDKHSSPQRQPGASE